MSLHRLPIVILGMQRSGTSALSGALSRLGVFFGNEELLYGADGNNEQGYFEHRKATAINLKILDEFQMHVTSFGSLPENWKEYPQALELRQLLKDFLKEEFDSRGRWGIKQPLTSLVLPIYNDVFAELGVTPQYLVCVRNPLEAMESESRLQFEGSYRVMQPLGKMAIGSWLRYTLGSICEAAPNPVMVIAYDELLTQTKAVLESIVASQEGWAPDAKAWEDAVGSIRPGLRHNSRQDSELDAFPSLVRRTYKAVLEPSSEVSMRLAPLYREFQMWTRMLGEPAAVPGKLGLSWLQDGVQRVSESSFPVNGEWQTVGLDVDAGPKTVVSGLVYGLPARVWIRRSVWNTAGGTTEATLKCGPGSSISHAHGVVRLDAAFEPHQIRLITPGGVGPYRLTMELLLETGLAIHLATATRVARQLERCVVAVQAISSKNQKRSL